VQPLERRGRREHGPPGQVEVAHRGAEVAVASAQSTTHHGE
jgi:hypothetical protein